MTGLALENIAKNYGVAAAEVQRDLEDAISIALTNAMGVDVHASFTVAGLELQGFDPDRGFFAIPIEKALPLIRVIRFAVERAIQAASTRKARASVLRLEKMAAAGRVVRILDNGTLLVELDIADAAGNITQFVGVCAVQDQPPHERKKYQIGDNRQWYVKQVATTQQKGVPKIEILLSRQSKELPACLLRRFQYEYGGDCGRVTCIHRVAGAYAEIVTTQRLDVKAIKAVGEELRERIKVRVVDPSKKK